MNNDDPRKALLVVTAVAFVCSILVSAAAITLRPIQDLNRLVERSRNVIALTGAVTAGGTPLSDEEIIDATERLDVRVVDLETGEFDTSIEPLDFDQRGAAQDDDLGIPIPAALDTARLGRRARFAVVYLVWDDDSLERVILPVYGQGMWSMLAGYIALEADLNTIAAVTFYEQAETAGLGDQIVRPDWHARWRGRRIYDPEGAVRFRVAASVAPAAADYSVDALTGATVTSDAVTALIGYWFGPHGYRPLLDRLSTNPPTPSDNGRSQR